MADKAYFVLVNLTAMSFYLCNNPLEVLPEGISAYIYGYDKPRFFGVVKRLGQGVTTSDIAYEGVTVMFYYQRPDEDKAGYYLLFASDNIDDTDPFELTRVLQEAVRWYVSLSGAALTVEEFDILKGYSQELPDFQVFEDSKTGECLLNFALGAHAFKSFTDAQAFMHKDLGIDRELVYCALPAVNMED